MLLQAAVEMSEVHVVDLDDALISWAMEKLGSDYTVEKVDASKVKTKAKFISYNLDLTSQPGTHVRTHPTLVLVFSQMSS